MELDKLTAFLGKPIKFDENIFLYSPTLNEICEVGEITYKLYLFLCSFDKKVILKNLLSVTDIELQQVEHLNDFYVLTRNESIRNEIGLALTFFIKKKMIFSHEIEAYVDENKNSCVSDKNFQDISKKISFLNGNIESEKNVSLKFKNEKAKKMFDKLTEFRNKKNNDNENLLDMKDMLSILCCAGGNGINVFNAGNLTVYQLFEHFERLNLKESHNRLIQVWANGKQLEENAKLPEWLTKSKL